MGVGRRSAISGFFTLMLGGSYGGAQSLSPPGTLAICSIGSLQNPSFLMAHRGARWFAKALGIGYRVIEDEGKLEPFKNGVIECCKDFSGNKILVVGLGREITVSEVAKLCFDMGIYFSTHSDDTPSISPWDTKPFYVAHIASNQKLAGSISAAALFSAVGSRGNFAALGPPPVSIAGADRRRGMEAQLGATPGYTLLELAPTNWQPSEAFEIARSWMARYRNDIQGIWAANDGLAIGAIEALRIYRSIGKVAVTGINGEPYSLESITKGEMTATVPWDTFYDAGLGLALAYSASSRLIDFNLIPDIKRQFYTQVRLVDRRNVESYSKYLETPEPNVDWKEMCLQRDLWGRMDTREKLK
jgi:ribose transport system substrate-binding protein